MNDRSMVGGRTMVGGRAMMDSHLLDKAKHLR
jgi:hypothetical protein